MTREFWHQAGDYVVDSRNLMVAATSQAAAFVHKDAWAQGNATFESDRVAKLIASAPNLLSSAKLVLAAANGTSAEMSEALEALENAVKQAEGQQ
jgi:hypothetical protein